MATSRSPGDFTESVAGTSQTDQAYERLREAIIGLELKPGALYTEAQLAEFVGLGRTPVREALHRLIREELVSTRRNRGIQVTPIDVIRQLQLLDVRRALERLLAERACAQATEQERREMLRLADVTEASAADNDIKAFLAVNRDVQDLKARAAHNEILQSTMDLFFGLSRRFWVAYSPRIPGSLQTASRLHARVLRAIAVGDRDAAASSTNELLDFLEDFTRRTVDLRIAVG